jgi:vacuolar-type H+-ATPase subunit I/STV1
MLIVFYFTGFILVFTYNLNPLDWMQMTDPTPLTFGLFPHITPTIPPALLVFLGGFLTPIMVMLVYMMKGHGIEGMSEVFDYALSLISHTLSYARILAINKVHAVLSALFLVTLPTIINISAIQDPHTALGVATGVGIVNIIFQIFIIMTLEALISFLQALRLNWVEFFSKFFEGRGHLFKPFSYVRRFTRSRS